MYKRKKGLVIIISLLLFLFLIPILIIQGKGYSFFNASIDLCNDVKNTIDKNLEPKLGSGIGYFITCPQKEIRKNLYSSKYILSKKYDLIFEDLNRKVISTMKDGLARKKRNNTYLNSVKELFKNDNKISEGFDSLISINEILYGFESFSICEYALNSIRFIEEKFCYSNLKVQQDTFIYYTLGTFGVLIVSIALNKISAFTRLPEKVKYSFYNLILRTNMIP